jgi:L-threonylcarbamoyladenylate synthase
MEVINFKKFNIDEEFEKSISAASELFSAGKIFIYPTDTIYGIGGNPFNESSVGRINNIKGRNTAKQFIWLIPSVDILRKYAEIYYESHLNFLNTIYPAPVTVVLNLNSRTKKIVGLNSAAFRIPDNHFCNKLLTEVGMPLISTSVNRSGKNALNDYIQIEKDFSKAVDALFYSKTKNIPLASTIIDLKREKPSLVREGTIKFVELLDKFN